MSAGLRVAAFVPYPAQTTPSQRFRIEQWTPLLEAAGIAVELKPFADRALLERLYLPGGALAKAARLLGASLRQLGRACGASRYDALVVHRAACLTGPALIERALAAGRAPLIYDFDDAIFRLHTSASNRGFGWLKFPGKTTAICRASDSVVVGNAYLAEYARRHNPRVTIVPTSVDTERFAPLAERAPGPRVVVGWTGSSTSQTHLEQFAPMLRELVARRPQVELRVVSDREPDLAGLPITWRRWSAAAEVDEIGAFDVGIMPMPDDEWARGKCGLKLLLSMAMAQATVSSPVGVNREIVRDGENGLLAASPDAWLAQLARLIDDAGLRQRLGRAARATVVADYSARRSAARFAEVVRDAVSRRRA